MECKERSAGTSHKLPGVAFREFCKIKDRAVSTSVKRQDDLISYELGNEVRGFESGEFPDDEIAWKVLSQKFNERFPSAAGRHVELRKVIRWGRVGPALESDPFDLFPIGDRPLN